MNATANRTLPGAVLALAVSTGLWTLPAIAADGLSSPWSSGTKSAARLIASGTFEAGSYQAGVEIRLDPGTLTYWRTPGDAGVPPVFDFQGSTNLSKAVVRYPAPKRYEEAGAEAFGYKDQVIFPVDVTPKDPRNPVRLALDLHYATCDQICLPAEAKADLLLQPRQRSGPEAALISSALARVPKIIAPTAGRGFAVEPVAGTAHATWKVRFSPPPSAQADLFAEGPDNYYFDTKRARDFTLVLAQKPANAKGLIPVTLTLVDGRAAYQSTIDLDVTPLTP